MTASTQPYIRTQMLPPVPPPAGEAGALKWLRENLFSGALNTVLTVLSLAAIAALIWAITPWFWNSVWVASSLDQCREILKERAGLGPDDPTPLGACFAVITERWKQLLYGFYPQELYWRANLNLLLLFVALVPVLFTEVSVRTRGITAAVLFVLSGLMVWGMYWSAMGAPLALAMLVLFAVIAGAIWRFDISRRWMLVFSMLYPFLMVWLVWGGSIWGPLLVLAGFVPAWLFYQLLGKSLGALAGTVGAIAAPVLYWLLVAPNLIAEFNSGVPVWSLVWLAWGLWLTILLMRHPFATQPPLLRMVGGISAFLLWGAAAVPALTLVFEGALLPLGTTAGYAIAGVESRDLGGFMVAIIIGVAGIALSLPIGIVLALGRQSKLLIVRTLCVGFIEFIRGVPLITLLFTASLLLNYFLPPGTNFDIILRVIIMVTLFSSAYMAETIRGGLAALPRGQYEAADSLGLDYWKAQRLIVMPQALKVSIPGIVNNFIGLFKDTTLVTFIGILDILNFTNSIRANAEWHGIYWELYLFVGFMFFIACFPMGRYSKWLEQKLRTDHR
jgi:general L-amino acid transport system permease protein